MRIAVSGTHCTGKSTLIDDFLAVRRDFAHEPEPYEWSEDADFSRQLEISIERWQTHAAGARVIGERCPLDFIAYLRATGEDAPVDEHVQRAMQHIDLLVLLAPDAISAPEDEDPELREAMHEQLIELVESVDVPVLELHGSRRERNALLLSRVK